MSSFLQSVHVRTLLVLSTVVIAMLLALGAWTHQLLRQSFERLEATEAAEEVRFTLQHFDDRCARMTAAAVSWSEWSGMESDLYRGLTSLPGEASALFELDFDESAPAMRRILLSDALTAEQLPALTAAVVAPGVTRELGSYGRALVHLDDGLVLVLWSNRVLIDGTIGAVVVGRRLDEAWISSFGEEIHHQVRLRPRSEVSLSEAVLMQLDGDQGMALQASDDDEMLAHGRIDLSGGPLVVTLSLDRGIVAAGELTWGIMITVIALTGGILVVVVLLLLEGTVLRRVTRLGRKLAHIVQTNDQVTLVDQTGGDEIARLSARINQLLTTQRGWQEQIARRTMSMRLIFDTLPIGLLTLDHQGRIQPDRSMATSELLGRRDLDGVDFAELLAPGSEGAIIRGRLADFLTLVRSGSIAAEELDAVNPMKTVTVQRTNGPLVLRLRFYSIEHGSGTTRRFRRETGSRAETSGVLVTITDISDERRLAAEVERSHADYERLKGMAEDVEQFHSFLEHLRAMVKQLSELSARMGSAPDRAQLSDLQRGVRAVRRGGAVFGLAGLEQATRGFDAELTHFLGMAHLSDVEIRRCRYGVADLEAAVIAIDRQFCALLGGGETTNSTSVLVGQRSAPAPSGEDQRAAKRATLAQLAGQLVQPARIGLAAVSRQIAPMLKRRGVEVRYTMQGEEVLIDQAHLEALNQVLPHLLRFACDQGFDSPSQREAAGKPPAPMLTLAIERRVRELVVTVADDGAGIDPQRMRTMAVEQNLMTAEAAAALDDHAAQALVFSLDYDQGDFSLSGVRPMGLNLIVKRVQDELHADLAIQSIPGQGTVVTITIPLAPV